MGTRRKRGELYADFACERGHKFELGPIRDPQAHESAPKTPKGTVRLKPGSGTAEHIPETTFCVECFEDDGSHIVAHPANPRALRKARREAKQREFTPNVGPKGLTGGL